MGVWELADYLKKERVVKGYVLYRKDGWCGSLYTRRNDIDLSANVATVYAGILQGILVDETMETYNGELSLASFDLRYAQRTNPVKA